MKTAIIITESLAALMLAAAWIKAERVWQWKVALLAQEFGHWLALLVLIAAIVAWFVFHGWRQLTVCSVGIALTISLLIPAFLASRATTGFSWTRLWLPWFYMHSSPTPERKVFWQEGGELLDLLVYRAQPTDARQRPWVLVLHTGGWDGGSAEEFADVHHELAAAGITVLAMNYRLAPKNPWPAQRDDVQRAVDWARVHAEELGIDPDQLILMGRSAGGQIASACGYSMPQLHARGVVLIYSPMDMVFARKFAYAEDILNSLQLLRQYLGGDPDAATEHYYSASAVNYVTAQTPPTLMIHGELDTMVWVEQSRRLTARLREAKVPCTYCELRCATHGFDYFPSTPGGQLAMREVLRFIDSVR